MSQVSANESAKGVLFLGLIFSVVGVGCLFYAALSIASKPLQAVAVGVVGAILLVTSLYGMYYSIKKSAEARETSVWVVIFEIFLP